MFFYKTLTMRKILLPFLALLGILYASCMRDTKCINPEYYTLAFSGTDTAANIEIYTKGSGFTKRLDSVYANYVYDEGRILIKLHTFKSKDINTYDWKISFLPTGRVYKITDITLIERELKLPQSDNRRCTNNVTLVANGQMYTAEGRSDVTSSVSFDIQ